MSYLVTGGTGFIGSHLIRELVNRGEEVIAYDYQPNYEAISDVKDKVKVIRGDVLDVTDLLECVKKYGVEYIVHLAYLLIPQSQEKPLKAIKVNCEGTTNIFEIARIMDVKRVVWASSISVYGRAEYYGHKPVNEDAPKMPLNVYGACKVLNEFMGEYYYEKYGLDNIGLRFTVVYGPGRARGQTAFASELIEGAALGRPVKVSYGNQKVDWQYVKDAVKAIILACNVKQTKHRIFNTCGELRTIYEAAEYIKKLIPDAVIHVEPGELGWQMEFDITRAKEELGYTPSYTMEEGIREHINIIRSRAGLPPV
ncbi:NAD(P)-dependent oxidoreductase [Candidatus Bathyarchaeota archaeon]|nr:NAD(P)-dependent oxidoreductase [Candidatus Bathyarchaeota archaeon]